MSKRGTFCQWIKSLHQRHSTGNNFGFLVSNFGNAALVCNKKKNFTGSFDLLAVSNDTISLTGMIMMFNRQAWCLDVFEEILLWIVRQNINKNKDSPYFRSVCFCRISLRPNTITGMSPESALCFHAVINSSAHLNKDCRYESAEVGLCSIIQQCCIRKLSWTELRLYIGFKKNCN